MNSGVFTLAQVWHWLLFAVIWLGPLPIVLGVVNLYQPEQDKGAIAKSLLSTLTLWCLVQIGLGKILGSLQLFALQPVLAAETLLAVAGVVLFWRSPQAFARVRKVWSALERRPLNPNEIFVLGCLGFVALVLIQRIATQPFTNYDTLWFHGPIIARWYQTASLSQLDPLGNWIIDHPDAQGYPYSWHVLSVFALLPWGQDIWMTLPMQLAWGLLGISIYLLSRYGGADRFYALAAAVLVLVMPFLLNHVTTLHIDLPLAAVYAASLCYLVAYYQTRQGWHACLCLALAGLVAGIKTPGLIYAALVVGLLSLTTVLPWLTTLKHNRAGSSAMGRGDRGGFAVGKVAKSRASSPLVWLGLMVGLSFGGFWYVVGDLVAGSAGAASLLAAEPASAANLAIAAAADVGLKTVPGRVPEAATFATAAQFQSLWQRALALQSTTLTAQFHWNNPSHWAIFGSQALVRLQLPFLALLIPVLLLPYAWVKSLPPNRHRLMGFVVLLVLTTVLYWNTPYSAGGELSPLVGFNMRYGFPALALLGSVSAMSATAVRLPQRWIAAVVVVSSLFGVVSSTIFDKIRAQSVMGLAGFWPSQLINQLRQKPLDAIATIYQLTVELGLTDILLYLMLFVSICGLCLIKVLWPETWLQLGRKFSNWLRPQGQYLALLLSGIALLLVTNHWLDVRAANHQRLYNNIDAVLAQHLKPGDRVAYFSSSQSYLLYGSHLDHEVIHLPFTADNTSSWLTTLRQANVAVVATEASRLSSSPAFLALSNPAGSLVPIPGHTVDQGLRLYKLKKE